MRLGEASLDPPGLGLKHLADVLEAARAELLVVLLVTRGRPGEHDVVAVVAARHTSLVVLRVVLKWQKHNCIKIYQFQLL